MKARVLFVFLIAFLLLSGCVEQPAAENAPEGFKFFEKGGAKIAYPENWEVVENFFGNAVAFRAPADNSGDLFREHVIMLYEDISGNPMDLGAYSKLSVDNLPLLITDAELVGISDYSLAGQPGKVMEYTGRQGAFDLHYFSYFTVKGNKAWVVAYNAEEAQYKKHLPTVKKMVDSFEIK